MSAEIVRLRPVSTREAKAEGNLALDSGDSFLDELIYGQSDTESPDYSNIGISDNLVQFPITRTLQINNFPVRKEGELIEIGDFAKARQIIAENKGAFLKISEAVRAAALRQQALCNPLDGDHGPIKSNILNFNSFQIKGIIPNNTVGLNSHLEDEHEHCGCGGDLENGRCTKCSKAA